MESDGTGGGRKVVGGKVQAFLTTKCAAKTPRWLTWLNVNCVSVLVILHAV